MNLRELPLEPPPERDSPEESLYDEMCWLFGQMMEEANSK